MKSLLLAMEAQVANLSAKAQKKLLIGHMSTATSEKPWRFSFLIL